MNRRKIRRIRVSLEIFEDFLLGNTRPADMEGLPKEFEILRVSDANRLGTGDFEVVIQSNEFSEVSKGKLIPEIYPNYRSKQ